MGNYTMAEKRRFARKLRKEATPAELHFREVLKKHGIKHKFQAIVLGYIVDFLVEKPRETIFELDGYWHDNEEQKEYDRRKDKALTELGYNVVRVYNEEALRFPGRVLIDAKVMRRYGLPPRVKKRKPRKKRHRLKTKNVNVNQYLVSRRVA
jgi:very-short-patch-repair endonuclease